MDRIEALAQAVAGEDWDTADTEQRQRWVAQTADALKRDVPSTEFAERALQLHRQGFSVPVPPAPAKKPSKFK